MNQRRPRRRPPALRRLAVGCVLAAGLTAALSVPASAATSATFSSGTLSVFGDSADNSILISRTSAGQIRVNGGAIAVSGARRPSPTRR